MERTGWSAAKWASEADVAASTVQRAIKPTYQFVTSSRTLAKLARAAQVDLPDLVTTHDSSKAAIQPKFLEIRYEVGAGMWRRVEDVTESYGSAPVMADPSYAAAPQWLERVVSDSMDLEYPIGTLLHVVDATHVHYSLAHNDHVIIERRSKGGSVFERTVKEVVFAADGPQFWGRSTNPKWNKAQNLAEMSEDETLEVEVVGLVVGSYRPRRKT